MARILVIDDDKGITDTISTILKTDDYVVSIAHNGEEGVNLCATTAFDLIITDIIMPKKDGIEFIVEMTKLNKHIPIIALSGGRRDLTSEFNLESATILGAQQTLKKPFSAVELLAVVKDVLEN